MITLSYFDMMGKFPEKLKEILKKASKSKNSQTKRLAISKVSCAFGYTLKWNLKIKAGKIPKEKDLSVYIEAQRGRSIYKTKIFDKVPQQVWDHFKIKDTMPLKYKVGDIVETIKGIRYYIYSFDLDDSGDYNCGKLTEKEWNIWSCLYDKGITKKVPLDQLTPQELINLSQYQAELLEEHKFGYEYFKERIKELKNGA